MASTTCACAGTWKAGDSVAGGHERHQLPVDLGRTAHEQVAPRADAADDEGVGPLRRQQHPRCVHAYGAAVSTTVWLRLIERQVERWPPYRSPVDVPVTGRSIERFGEFR